MWMLLLLAWLAAGVIVASLWAVARGGDALPYHNTDDED